MKKATRAKQVHGMFVGINQYADPDARLFGCVNDALDWRALFASRLSGTPLLLLDKKATATAIVNGMRSTIAKLKPGDLGIIQFSGHGTWVPDRDGDELDGRDEALVNWDYNRRIILDDELRKIFLKIPLGARVLYITDSCHSGTVFRFLPSLHGSDVPKRRPRFLPPSRLGLLEGDDVTLSRALAAKPPAKKRELPLSNVIHLSGCQDFEYSFDSEFSGRPNGAMSYVAIAAWKKLKATATPAAWHQAIRKRLPAVDAPQTPLLNVAKELRNRPLFG